jgi:capsular polysaccharide biosynthesis protein
MHWRSRLPAFVGAAAGVAVAAVLTLLQSSTYQAGASIVLVRQGQPPGSDPALAEAADTAVGLFHSRAVAEPALANLRLEESADELLDRFSVETEPESSLVRISVEADSRDEARRTAQELTELSTVLFNDRFGPATVASVWEAPRAQADRVSPKPVRNLAVGALVGALLGWVVGIAGRGRLPERPKRSKQPKVPAQQVALVAPVPAAESAPVPEPVAEPAPEPVPEPEPQPEGPFVLPYLGDWTVRDVERLLDEQGDAFPDRREELEVYLDSFRGVAAPDGRLPGGVEAVMEDVFRDLIARAKTSA